MPEGAKLSRSTLEKATILHPAAELHDSIERDCRLFSSNEGAGPSFSVVICTDDRVEHLRRALSSLKYQTYRNFEVCVVAGPTEDGTREFLSTFAGAKVAHCTERNLSVSRNIGVAAADGEVIAFMDDDAVPEPEWLEQLARSYDDERVGAAGGVVHDHIGIDYQARFVTVDRLGRPREETRPTPELNYPGSLQLPHLLGTNCSFRRSALLEIGGFDETYEYFLDETDVCCRINDAGYRIVQRPDAFVHHKYAASAVRDEQRTVREWYPLIKNRLYFGMRHGRGTFDPSAILEAAFAERSFWQRDVEENIRRGSLPEDHLQRFHEQAEAGIEEALRLAAEGPKLLKEETLDAWRADFKPFIPPSEKRPEARIYLALDEGSGSSLLRSAEDDARLGHQVHLIVRRNALASVDFEDGIWIYDLGDEDPESGEGTSDLSNTVRRIASRRRIGSVFGSAAALEIVEGIV